MPISPPLETLLDQPPMGLMELFGRMRSLTDEAGFDGTLPIVWQCSDESQKIKKSLFGYVYDCPVFNLGRVGALDRSEPSDSGITSRSGPGYSWREPHRRHRGGWIGYVERIHGKVAPCCGMLNRLMSPYHDPLPARGNLDHPIPWPRRLEGRDPLQIPVAQKHR